MVLNATPIAVADDHYVLEDHVLAPPAEYGVLANDADDDSDPLTAVLQSNPAHGSLEFFSDGSFIYTPDPDYYGPDEFTYLASDGQANSQVVTVSIWIVSLNDNPVAEGDAYEVRAGQVLEVGAGGVLVNDYDVDGEELSAQLVMPPAHGSLTLNLDGSFVYTPDAGFSGTDSFTYCATDGVLLSDDVTVTITVAANSPPVAMGNYFWVYEDYTLVVWPWDGVLVNDDDPDDDPLTAVLVSGPAHGGLTLNPDGSFTYVPNANFSGLDEFTYVANDGEADSDPVTVILEVLAVNDSPVAVDDVYTMLEGGYLMVSPAEGVLLNDSDPDGDYLNAELVQGPAVGTLQFYSDGRFDYSPPANYWGVVTFVYRISDWQWGTAEATVTINVELVNDAPQAAENYYTLLEDHTLTVDAPGVLANDTDSDYGQTLTAVLVSGPSHGTLTLELDGSFTYTPDQDFYGQDWFTYVACDGIEESSPVVVWLQVTTVNDAPAGDHDEYSLDENSTLVVDASSGVLANDSDADGDELTAVLVDGPFHGTLTLNADGSFTYTPDAGYEGYDYFTYQASDGAALSDLMTVLLTVLPVNQAPEVTSLVCIIEDGWLFLQGTVSDDEETYGYTVHLGGCAGTYTAIVRNGEFSSHPILYNTEWENYSVWAYVVDSHGAQSERYFAFV